jgi:LysM repeat protein
MDSLNLVDLIHSNLTDNFVSRLSSFLGEDRDRTHAGINAAVPGILSSFVNVGSTTDGSRRLAAATDSANGDLLSSIGNFFEKRFSGDAGTGSLRSLLGAVGFSELADKVGKSSGLSGKVVTTLLGVMTPIVLGVLKKVKDSRGLDAMGLSNLLSSQRNNFAVATPSTVADVTSGTQHPYTRNTIREDEDAERAGRPDYTRTEEHTARRSLSWIVPLLILAGLIGLIWHWAGRSGVQANREDNGVAERTARLRDEYKSRAMPSFQALRMKYEPVIQEAQKQGVHISKLGEQDGKLVIEGTAPSLDAANKVWDEIKRVDPNMEGLMANFPVSSPEATTPAESSSNGETGSSPPSDENDVSRAKPAMPAAPEGGMYTVKPGDTLSRISQHFYGNTQDYKRILEANKGQLTNPDLIHVGQQLTIPTD